MEIVKIGENYGDSEKWAQQTTIKFKDPQEADSGEYLCKYKDKSSSVKVQFLQPIKFTESPDDPDFTKVLVKGKDDKVTCQATPDGLKYSWRKPDGETVESQSFDVNLETDDLRKDFKIKDKLDVLDRL